MNSAVNFIIESGVSLALLSLIYILFLRKETFFRLNRLFLLSSVVFSLLLPFLRLRVYEPQSVILDEIKVTPYRNLMEAVTVYSHGFSGTVENTISSNQFIILLYLGGLLFFMGRFLFRLIQIGLLIQKHPVNRAGRVRFVSIEKNSSPFSFLNFIFLNTGQKHDPGYEKMIRHEMEHVKQGHSFDVFLLEILTVLQWFNPFMWMLKRVVRENHEYLADKAVVGSGVNLAFYKQLLLNQAIGFQPELANHFNSSLIKKRIKMISKIKSSKMANLKYVIGLLTVVALVIAFACEQKETMNTEPVTDEQIVVLEIDGKKLTVTGENAVESMKKLMDSDKYEINVVEEVDVTSLKLVKKEEVKEPEMEDINGEDIFYVVEEMPEFPGGETALRQFIASTVKYPEEAQKGGIQGKVYVSFVVTKNGSIANAKVVRGVHSSLDMEALKVVNSQPKWKPGKQRGEAVNVQYTVPINFVLQ